MKESDMKNDKENTAFYEEIECDEILVERDDYLELGFDEDYNGYLDDVISDREDFWNDYLQELRKTG